MTVSSKSSEKDVKSLYDGASTSSSHTSLEDLEKHPTVSREPISCLSKVLQKFCCFTQAKDDSKHSVPGFDLHNEPIKPVKMIPREARTIELRPGYRWPTEFSLLPSPRYPLRLDVEKAVRRSGSNAPAASTAEATAAPRCESPPLGIGRQMALAHVVAMLPFPDAFCLAITSKVMWKTACAVTDLKIKKLEYRDRLLRIGIGELDHRRSKSIILINEG